ncbi:MAG: glycosyltransferase [Oscillospiraceae bacterium]|nr:glycosyltransferase [Oscillospiraceae bacterium]
MRILIAGRGFDTPGEHRVGVFELDQAKALRDAGHDVRFAAVDTRSLRRRRPLGCREYRLDGIGVWSCAVPAGARPAALAGFAQRAAAASIWKRVTADGWTPELVHAHFGAALLREARRRGIPTVYTEHSSQANRDVPDAAELRREQEYCALADRVICVSSALAGRLRAHTGTVPLIVPNVIDTAAFTAPPTEKSGTGGFAFVSAGNMIPVKGFDILLAAFAGLAARREAVTLTLIGDGPSEAVLRASARDLGIDRRVRFTGRLSRAEMAAEYRKADAFVLASRSETFGVVYAEAMAAGLPVIASRCGGPEDFVSDGSGILVPTEDAEALAAAMEQMISHRNEYDSAAIAAAARESFSPGTVAARLTAVYEELVKC